MRETSMKNIQEHKQILQCKFEIHWSYAEKYELRVCIEYVYRYAYTVC